MVVIDEFGVVQGLVTPLDAMEAIAGEFPDEDKHRILLLMVMVGW